MPGFIARHGLYSDAQREMVKHIKAMVSDRTLLLIRVAWEDPHGILHSKTLLPQAFFHSLEGGLPISMASGWVDSGGVSLGHPFREGGGFKSPDLMGTPTTILVPDPASFQVIPWAERSAVILCDQYFQNGQPMVLASRLVLKNALKELAQRGLELMVGLEVQWYLAHLSVPTDSGARVGVAGQPGQPTSVSPVDSSYRHLIEPSNPAIHDLWRVLAEHLVAMGIPLRSMEKGGAPGQMEFTFEPLPGLKAADTMLLFRMATKQICQQQGYVASFMCCPSLNGAQANGWHLHQTVLETATGRNTFMANDETKLLSPFGKFFVGGLLNHAGAAAVFTTPTVNGYRRLRPQFLAPDRADWGLENRGAMIRVQGPAGDANTHIENRVGEPAANPYLYLAAQIISGLDGVDRQLDPGELSDVPYTAPCTRLPHSLMEAIAHLQKSTLFKDKMGAAFIEFILKMKESEIARFLTDTGEISGTSAQSDRTEFGRTESNRPETPVTDWEQREYFELV